MSQKTDRELLEEMHQWIEHLDKDQALHLQRLEELCKTVKQHDLDLNGNGKSGLKADMHLVRSVIWPVILAVILAAVAAWLDLVVW